MRLRPLKNTKELMNNSKYLIKDPFMHKGKWNKLFNNNNPIYIEIGMGLGNFIIENAIKYPNINFIGIEKFDSVISRAIKKIETKELNNLYLIRIDALELINIFDQEIDKLYLNFSDPWPKDRHAKKRLTSPIFLNIYNKILKEDMLIEQKTDNIDLFNYSVDSLKKYGYNVEIKGLDVNNIETEYEIKFKNKGIKINRLIATKKRG